MKKILTTLACVLLVATAHAKLGETRDQIINRFGRTQITQQDANSITFQGSNHVEIVFVEGVSVIEAYTIPGKYDKMVIREIVETVTGTKSTIDVWETAQEQGYTVGVTKDGRFMTLLIKSPEKYSVAVGLTKAMKLFITGVNEAIVEESGGKPAVAEPREKDCAVLAAENYARLRKVTPWARIVAFRGTKDWGVTYFGHAGVVYKFEKDGEVYFIDVQGTIPLMMKKTDAQSITDAINAKLERMNNGYHIDKTIFLTKATY